MRFCGWLSECRVAPFPRRRQINNDVCRLTTLSSRLAAASWFFIWQRRAAYRAQTAHCLHLSELLAQVPRSNAPLRIFSLLSFRHRCWRRLFHQRDNVAHAKNAAAIRAASNLQARRFRRCRQLDQLARGAHDGAARAASPSTRVSTIPVSRRARRTTEQD